MDFHSGLDIDIIVYIFVIIETLALTLHAAGALESGKGQAGFSRREKLCCLTPMCVNRNSIEIRHLLSLEMALCSRKGIYNSQNYIRL